MKYPIKSSISFAFFAFKDKVTTKETCGAGTGRTKDPALWTFLAVFIMDLFIDYLLEIVIAMVCLFGTSVLLILRSRCCKPQPSLVQKAECISFQRPNEETKLHSESQLRIKIFFGSQSGTAKKFAEMLKQDLERRKHAPVHVQDLGTCDPEDLAQEQNLGDIVFVKKTKNVFRIGRLVSVSPNKKRFRIKMDSDTKPSSFALNAIIDVPTEGQWNTFRNLAKARQGKYKQAKEEHLNSQRNSLLGSSSEASIVDERSDSSDWEEEDNIPLSVIKKQLVEGKQVQCVVCNALFSTVGDLMDHTMIVHSNQSDEESPMEAEESLQTDVVEQPVPASTAPTAGPSYVLEPPIPRAWDQHGRYKTLRNIRLNKRQRARLNSKRSDTIRRARQHAEAAAADEPSD